MTRLQALAWGGGTVLVIVGVMIFCLSVIDVPKRIIPPDFHREDQCERLREDSKILEPENTWSNIGYLFAGVLVFYRSSRFRGLVVGLALCFTGVFSAMYHAVPINGTLQTFDIAAVYWVLLVMIGYASMSLAARSEGDEPSLVVQKFLAVGAFAVGLVMAVTRSQVAIFESTRAVVAMVLVLVVLLVLGVFVRNRAGAKMTGREVIGYSMGMGGLGAFSAAFRLTDGAGRVGCDPGNPLQFHALWHLFSAALLLLAFDFFARVGEQPGDRMLAD
jgi:Ceramidase